MTPAAAEDNRVATMKARSKRMLMGGVAGRDAPGRRKWFVRIVSLVTTLLNRMQQRVEFPKQMVVRL